MRRVALVVALVAGLAPACLADSPTLDDRAAAIERASAEPDGERVVVGYISRALALPVSTLRADRARAKLGWGQVFIAHHLARPGRLTFDQVVAEFRNGKTWEQIAADLGVDPAALGTDVARAQETVERRGEDKGATARGSETPATSHSTGKSGTHSGGGGMGRGRY